MKHDELIRSMTLAEKASLMSGKDFWQTMNIDRLGIPSIFLADGPHGLRKQIAAADHLGLNESTKATCFPTSACIANSWNEAVAQACGRALGHEALSQKVHVILGPGVNMKRNPRCGRNFEYYAEDPYLAGKMAAATIRGMQSQGIAACVKHFAANNQETRRMVVDTIVDERALQEIYLTAFEIAVKEGQAKSIMSAYNKLGGVYANENQHLLLDVLRREWGFDGVVVSDWGGNNDRVAALRAGNELEMPTTCGDTNRDILKAIECGELDEADLDACVDRLLTLIFDTEAAFAGGKGHFEVEAHHGVAQRAAEESIVLLKNKNGLLPLKEKTKVAVIGDFAEVPRYQGAGSSIVNPTKIDSALEVIQASSLCFVGYAKGFERYGRKRAANVRQAVQLTDKAEAILLYVGLDEYTEVEGFDRQTVQLPENQLALIDALAETGKPIIAVLACGSVIEMGWADKVDGVVYASLPGQAGSKAIIDVITGAVNPSGKLAETYPARYEDCPSAAQYPSLESAEYRESIFIGYRYFDTANVKAAYPFGFGLSYTTFTYSGMQADATGVSFDITNTGAVAGAEVAQMYIAKPDSAIFRPKKELKGFAKVFLQPGETKRVTLRFDTYSFRYFNVKSRGWEVEPGEYEVLVAASCEDVRLQATVFVQGTETECPYDRTALPSYYGGRAGNVDAEEFAALLGYKPPDAAIKFVKKNRIAVDTNTTVERLRYARGWTGRVFSSAVRFAIWALRMLGHRKLSNTMVMGVLHQPLRGVSRMSGGMISWGQLVGLIAMFNGELWKGLRIFFREGRVKKKRSKAKEGSNQYGSAC